MRIAGILRRCHPHNVQYIFYKGASDCVFFFRTNATFTLINIKKVIMWEEDLILLFNWSGEDKNT